MDNKTVVNQDLGSQQTSVNPVINSSTEVNPVVLGKATEISNGTVILDNYRIKEKLSNSGEADLFLCEKDGKNYVIKFYRREKAIKSEVVEAIKSIKSPYVAQIVDSGKYEDKLYEILPYYKNGSLQGKTFSYEQLRDKIIPSINEALRVLHNCSAHIIHKDIKPSNIMMLDDGNVALIDFGISSNLRDGKTMLVTETGMTPEYSAPEAIRNLFLIESDYYSFGITIYELFCGHTPYYNLSTDDFIRYSSVQQLPFPDNMPKQLKDLIIALTYNDLKNRNDKNNPNRRWTYEEVDNWCKGKTYVLPGEGVAEAPQWKQIPYKINHQEYYSVRELVPALAENWEEGKKHLFRGLLSGYFKQFDPEMAGYVLDAEDEAAVTNPNEDYIFFKLLYRMDPDFKAFCWKEKRYNNIVDLGKEMLDSLWNNQKQDNDFWNEILQNNLLSEYFNLIGTSNKDLNDAVRALESAYMYKKNNKDQKTLIYFKMAYLLSGVKEFRIAQRSFSDIPALADYMKELLDKSFEDFETFCRKLINETDNLDPQFEGWLTALGKSNEIKQWKDNIKNI